MADPKRKRDFEDWYLEGSNWRWIVVYLFSIAYPLAIGAIIVAVMVALASLGS
ncbi:MAG: hypothetical protein ACF8PN_07230 [Phycisphaerales bacterium]